MKGLGVVVLVVGVFVVLGAMMMDVSVPSGVGRVNNIGLMAERQNFTLIGAVLSIAGLLMLLLGRRKVLLNAPRVDAPQERIKLSGGGYVDSEGSKGDYSSLFWILGVVVASVLLLALLGGFG